MGYGFDGYDEDEDDAQDQRADGPQGLRAHLKTLEKQVKELAKANAELQKQNAELGTKARSSTLEDILRSKKVDPTVSAKIVRLIPDSVEATDEAVTKWLDDYKDILPVAKPAVDPTAQKREPAADDNQLLEDSHRFDEGEGDDDDELAAMRAVFEQTQRAVAGATPGGQRQDVESRLNEIADTTESFDAAIAALGKLPGFKVGGYQS